MKSKSGFTIVELVIVIAVIVILAAISAVTYIQIRAESRDVKRKADIEIVVNLFERYYERNGQYPTGCSRQTELNKSNCAPLGGTAKPLPTVNTDAFYADTTLSQIQAVFPELADDFGDPDRTQNNPFQGFTYGANTPNYFYLGELMGQSGSSLGTIFGSNSSSNEINCNSVNIGIEASPNTPTTYVLGYWDETDGQWHIYQGKYGTELRIVTNSQPVRGTTSGICVFEQ